MCFFSLGLIPVDLHLHQWIYDLKYLLLQKIKGFILSLLAMMEHRMMKEAKQAWQNGQVYMPLSHVSSQMNPALYGGIYIRLTHLY